MSNIYELLMDNAVICQNHEKLIPLVIMLQQSREAYKAGDYMSANKAFAEIRKNIANKGRK